MFWDHLRDENKNEEIDNNMPLNAYGWSTEESEKLAELVEPHSYLYNVQDPSRKNILARESTWQEIAQQLSKPVEECKKRWRGLRDGYMRNKRFGKMHFTKLGVFQKLQFLDETSVEGNVEVMETEEDSVAKTILGTDDQEYYEITVVDEPQVQDAKSFIKILPKLDSSNEPPKKIGRKNCGRKKSIPLPRNMTPVKILPKPILVNGPKIVQYIEDQKQPEQRSQTIDKLIEKILKENTNEIDVFFRSMAASVKKLQPNLIPKVKMEVCNVIAKYEMQSFDKGNLNF